MPCAVTIDAVCPTTGARATTITTPRGALQTPCFMPVGTYGAVKAIAGPTLAKFGYPVLLANALHLYLRPGLEVIHAVGGLHRFMGWDRHLLTDSGGYQLFSLREFITLHEDGVHFRAPVDGSRHNLTPGLIMDIQRTLGADFIMPLDHCPPSTASRAEIGQAMERTHRWLAEQVTLFQEGQAGSDAAAGEFLPGAESPWSLFGIVQGGVEPDLRRESLAAIAASGVDAIAIGGLAVGESQREMFRVLEALQEDLPADKPHYLMGVGFPDDLLGAVARGIDMFDCVIPTRVARNTTALTSEGRINLRHTRHRTDTGPLDPACDCETCTTTSRALLCHLVKLKHLSASTLLTHHNLYFYRQMVVRAREAILAGTFPDFLRSFLEPGWTDDALRRTTEPPEVDA
ncbi:MAG: Queuine tRNA-ribosyltransferase [bacterium]|nr:Queuine tRNA-ribosyltransferase [bacterium]